MSAARALGAALAWALSAGAWAGTLSGVVRERGTGDPIAEATVTLRGVASAQLLTGPDGRFAVEVPDTGALDLRVEALGYEPGGLTLTLPLEDPVRVWLDPGEAALEIVVEARRSTPHSTAHVLDRERMEKTPGTYGDPIRLLQTLPGVATTPEYSPRAGDVSVRGAAPNETRFFLDGVEIPYLFHFQQYASVFHTRLLDELAFYPSTFGAPYGNATGGIAWAQSRRPDADHARAGLELSTIMFGGYASTPVGPGVVSASARRSFHDLAESGNNQFTVWPAFWDYLARYDQDLGSPDHHASITLFGAGDAYARYAGDVALLDPYEQSQNPEFTYDRAFHAVALRLEDSLPRAQLRTSLALVQDRWGGAVPTATQLRQERYAWLRNDTRVELGERAALATGLELRGQVVSRRSDNTSPLPEVEDEAPILAWGEPVDESLRGVMLATWLEPRLQLGWLVAQPGLRLMVDSPSRSVALDPRLLLRAEPAADLRLFAAAGRYTQAPGIDALSPTTGDPTLTAGRSDQLSAGVDYALAGRLELGAQAWGKRLDGVVTLLPGQAPQALDGYAWGVELTGRYRLREVFFTSASVVVGRSFRGGAPFDWDQPLSVSLLASWDFRRHWNLGARYRYATGLPYTPITGGLYEGDTDTYSPVLGATNSARLPNYQKFDVHLERRFTLNTWTLVAFVEMWVVPPANNAMYLVYSYDYSQSAVVSGPPLFPLFGLRADL